jgi:hypothetical protein
VSRRSRSKDNHEFDPDALDALRRALRDDIRSLALELLGDPGPAGTKKLELRYGKQGALRVWISGRKRGGWCDFSEGPDEHVGDPIGLIRRVRRFSFVEAVHWAADRHGIDLHKPPPPPPDDPAIREKLRLEQLEKEQKRLKEEAEAARQLIERIDLARRRSGPQTMVLPNRPSRDAGRTEHRRASHDPG